MVVRVGRELNETINFNFNGLFRGVEAAGRLSTLVRGVGVLRVRGQTEKLNITVSKFSSSTVATTSTTTLVAVAHTADKLLSGELL